MKTIFVWEGRKAAEDGFLRGFSQAWKKPNLIHYVNPLFVTI